MIEAIAMIGFTFIALIVLAVVTILVNNNEREE